MLRFLFRLIFVAADHALVIDRKMPFPDKGLFGACAGGGRIPEKLLIGAGAILHRRRFAYLQSERCPRLLFFMGREVFGACQKKSVSRIVPNAAIRLFASMRRRIRIEKRSKRDQIERSALNDDPCRRVFFNNAFFRLKKRRPFGRRSKFSAMRLFVAWLSARWSASVRL